MTHKRSSRPAARTTSVHGDQHRRLVLGRSDATAAPYWIGLFGENAPAMTDASDPSLAYFATRFVPDARRRQVWQHLAAYLHRWLPTDGALLDLGAGYADLANAAPCARRVAFDMRADLADYVAPGVEAEVGDVTDLSRFATDTFDAVFASNLLEHLDWPQLERCVDEVVRVLKSGGHFITVQPNFRLNPRRYFDDFTHRTIFTDVSLGDFLASRGLIVARCEARFLPLTMKSRLSFGHRLIPLYLRLPFRPFAGQMLVVARHT